MLTFQFIHTEAWALGSYRLRIQNCDKTVPRTRYRSFNLPNVEHNRTETTDLFID